MSFGTGFQVGDPTLLRVQAERRAERGPSLLLLALAAGVLSVALFASPRPLRSSPQTTGDFTNFESLPVHPLALTPDGTRLLALNMPDARLEVRLIRPGGIDSLLGEVPVGLEPVSVAARSDSEAWVVNQVSDDVDVVDLSTFHVKATLRVGDAPTDVAFAGSPRRAFVCVSGEDAVKLYDPANLAAAPVVRPVFGRHPRALAVGAGGSEVYVAILDAGNHTTTLPASIVQAGGGAPPPNPPATVDSIPQTGLIVQDVAGHWIDDGGPGPNPKVWDAFVPFTLPALGVEVLDGSTGDSLRSVGDVGTSLFNIAVAPGGTLFVTNTEAFNRTRFEPNQQGRFLQDRVTLIGSGGAGPVTPVHLNAHINYGTIPGPPSERALSLAEPLDITVNGAGTKVYLAALGSGTVGVLDASGAVTNRIPTTAAADPSGQGPAGLALDEAHHHLYVLNRLVNSISVLDTQSETFVSELPLRFDPSPPEVRDGRRFLYSATNLSGHGDLACASCHIGGAMDNLAWDLGNPQGTKTLPPPGQLAPGLRPFNPMKGPMTTQSLRGLLGTTPFHWRGDRADFTRFNPAFISLMGAPDSLSTVDMQAYSNFVMTITYPPNPDLNLDRSLPNPATGPSPLRGQTEFETKPHEGSTIVCSTCHAFPTGTDGQIIPAGVIQESQQMKVPHLRNLYEKTGFLRLAGAVNKRGFGFIHDGSTDILFDFLKLPVFTFANDGERRDLEAYLLSFDTGTAPAVGRELTINGDTKSLPAVTGLLDSLYAQADVQNCDLVAHGLIGGVHKGFVYIGSRTFRSDYNPEGDISADSLRSLAVNGGEITYLGVPPGSGVRMGIDRDRDGYRDRWEIALGSDPANPASVPSVSAVATGPPAAPAVRLGQNAPNPFNPSTTIPYQTGTAGRVTLRVFDVSGRAVRTLVDAVLPGGSYVARWDGRDDRGRALASGRYFYRLRVGGIEKIRGMTLLK